MMSYVSLLGKIKFICGLWQSDCKKDRNSVHFEITMQSRNRPKIGLICNQAARLGENGPKRVRTFSSHERPIIFY